MIKVIFFDLGGVLFTNGAKKFVDYLSNTHNLDSEKIHDVINGTLGSNYRVGKIGREEFWTDALAVLGIKESMDKLEKEWENGYELIEETKNIINELSKRYKVFFLSDNLKSRVERLQKRYRFLDLFEDGVFSHEVGVRKPHPKIYKLALDKAKVDPQEALFIDDKESSLIPASKMGMKTILFIKPEALRKKLVEIGIL